MADEEDPEEAIRIDLTEQDALSYQNKSRLNQTAKSNNS